MTTMKNRVQLIGHLGKDPEVKLFDKDRKRASFSIATNESYKNQKGEKVTQTEWHNVVAWGTTASFIENYLNKGIYIGLEGKISNRVYESKGEKKYITEIVANDIVILSSKKED